LRAGKPVLRAVDREDALAPHGDAAVGRDPDAAVRPLVDAGDVVVGEAVLAGVVGDRPALDAVEAARVGAYPEDAVACREERGGTPQLRGQAGGGEDAPALSVEVGERPLAGPDPQASGAVFGEREDGL